MNDLDHRRMRDLLGPYVLGSLAPEEELEITDHLDGCLYCRNEEQDLRQAHEYMSDLAVVFEAPPPELKSRAARGVRRRRPRWAWLAAAVLCVLVGLAAAYSSGVFTSQETVAATLKPTQLAPEAGGEIRLKGTGENITLRLEAWGLPSCRGDEYYELWFVEGEERLSAGTFTVGPSGRVRVDFNAPGLSREYPKVGITSETIPGDPGPSTKKMLGGELRES